MKYLGNGAARIAFFQDDGTVLKIPLNESGLQQNNEEYEIYNSAKDKSCLCKIFEKTNKGWLVCEYLENATDTIKHYQEDGIFCEKYDTSTEKSLHVNCDLNCANCKFNTLKGLHYDLAKFDTYNTDKLLQVGFDKDGVLKLFDFGTPNSNVKRHFHKGYLKLFNEWIESDSELFFEDWVGDKVPEKFSVSPAKMLQNCNRIKRQIAIKKKQKRE